MRRAGPAAADEALKNDLALASQAQGYQPQQFMSPTEQGMNPYALARAVGGRVTAQSVYNFNL